MINVSNRKCLDENCNIQPFFNYYNEKYAIYCSKHKT